MSNLTGSSEDVDWNVVTDQHTSDALRSSHVELTGKLNCRGVTDILFKNRILLTDDMEEIASHAIQREARNALLAVVRTRSVRGFRFFVQALRDTAQDELYTTLMTELKNLVPLAFPAASGMSTLPPSQDVIAVQEAVAHASVTPAQQTQVHEDVTMDDSESNIC